MSHSQVTFLIAVFLVLEFVNVAINILPARRCTTAAERRPYYLRAGRFNLVVVVCLAVYVCLHR